MKDSRERSTRQFAQRARPIISHLVVVVVVVGATACQAPSEGTVLLDLAHFASPDVPGLKDVSALLTLESTNGTPAVMNVQTVNDDGSDEWRLVTSPVPMECDGGFCTLTFAIDPGNYNAALDVFARDRCGSLAQVAAALPLGGNPVTISGIASLTLDDVSYAFDDDDDGTENILEPLACGRFDHDDRDRPAAFCVDEGDPCCSEFAGRALVSRMATFDGGTLVHTTGPSADVAPFMLDATEVTYGSFVRCVAAGACLAGFPDHPVRVAAETTPLEMPVTGLLPGEAQSYCAWLGKRLPLDDEWSFAAAMDGETRMSLPFDPDAPEILLARAGAPGDRVDDETAAACEPTLSRTAFNHRALGETCPLKSTGVGSYPSSYNYRGRGSPLADMAGNVYEWTVDALVDGTTDAAVPSGVSTLRLRGGYYGSAPLLVENDYPVTISVADSPEEHANALAPYLAITGFRCAAFVDDVFVAPAEPLCPAD